MFVKIFRCLASAIVCWYAILLGYSRAMQVASTWLNFAVMRSEYKKYTVQLGATLLVCSLRSLAQAGLSAALGQNAAPFGTPHSHRQLVYSATNFFCSPSGSVGALGCWQLWKGIERQLWKRINAVYSIIWGGEASSNRIGGALQVAPQFGRWRTVGESNGWVRHQAASERQR